MNSWITFSPLCFLSRIQNKFGSKFSQIHQIKQWKGPGYPENEVWNHSKQHYLVHNCTIYTNPRRFDCEGKRNEVTPWTCWGEWQLLTQEVEIESCPDSPHTFLFWDDVPILLLNLSIRWLRAEASTSVSFLFLQVNELQRMTENIFCL